MMTSEEVLSGNDAMQFLSVTEFARRYHCSRMTVYRHARRGALRTVRIGKMLRILDDIAPQFQIETQT